MVITGVRLKVDNIEPHQKAREPTTSTLHRSGKRLSERRWWRITISFNQLLANFLCIILLFIVTQNFSMFLEMYFFNLNSRAETLSFCLLPFLHKSYNWCLICFQAWHSKHTPLQFYIKISSEARIQEIHSLFLGHCSIYLFLHILNITTRLCCRIWQLNSANNVM